MRRTLGLSSALGVLAAGLIGAAAGCWSCSSSTSTPNEVSGADAAPEAGADSRSDAGADRRDAGSDAPEAAVDWGDSGLPAEQAWLLDPTAWNPVPGSEFMHPRCELKSAVPEKIGFPKLVWAPCADASFCEEAEVVHGYGDAMWRPTMSTHVAENVAVPLLGGQMPAKSATQHFLLRRTVELLGGTSTDVVMAQSPANAVVSSCSFGANEESARMILVTGTGSDAALWELAGFANSPGASGFWNQPWLPTSVKAGFSSDFDIDHGGGINFLLSLGLVAAELTPGSSEATKLTSGLGFLQGAGEGDLAIWSMANTTEFNIQGWSPDGGVRVIIPEMSTYTCGVGISPTTLVGFTGEMASQFCSDIKNPRLWATPRAYSPSEVKLTISPPFATNPHVGGKLVTWGDFVAADTRDTTIPNNEYGVPLNYLLVARISDWTFRKIQSSGEYGIHPMAFTLTDTHLYVAFSKNVAAETDKIRTVRRYDLAHFDQIGQAM